MNADLIDLYRCIQHRRGEWKVGDRVIHDLYGPGIVVGVDDSLRLNVTFTDCKIEPLQGHEANLLWLPPVWSDDGRCLIGMLGGNGELAWVENGEYAVFVYDEDTCDQKSFYGATPDEALLRAIREQEGSNADG